MMQRSSSLPDRLIDLEDKGKIKMKGSIKFAYVVSVYDGDTFWIKMPFNGHNYHWKCRLKGVDTPELRPSKEKSPIDRKIEKIKAKESRDFVRESILHKYVLVNCDGQGKYGRLLVDVTLPDGSDLGKVLIDNELGVPYFGGKRC